MDCMLKIILRRYNGTNYCDYDQTFVFNANGTVALWNTQTVHNSKMAYYQ